MVLHAYRGIEPRGFTVRCSDVGGELAVVVQDRGTGMRPNPESPGLGLGHSIMASVADVVQIESLDSGTRVRMTFRTRHP